MSYTILTTPPRIVVEAARRLRHAQLKPRGFSPIGLFGPLDGNIVGGALLGVGMALSGACPGTVFPQIALNIESGWWALQGALVGGAVWTGFLQPYVASRPKPALTESQKQRVAIPGALGVSQPVAVAGFAGVMATGLAVAAAVTSPGPEAKIHPILGGVLIGAAQLFSLLARKSLVGTSSSFEEAGSFFWGWVKGDKRPRSTSSIVFCVGMVSGAWLAAAAFPQLAEPARIQVSAASAFAGGALMTVGARTAGGCTSGHGISGMSLLSVSSVVTIASAFATGAVFATSLY